MNQTYAVVENGIVTNLVIWDGNTSTWEPPGEAYLIPPNTFVDLGYTYEDGKYTAPS